jgi:hypothetical protein
MRGTVPRATLGLLAALVFSGCTEPPAREVAAAEAALGDARRQEADRYAPERWKEAQSAVSQARRKIEEKDYRSALSSATDAIDKSRQAGQAAAEAKLQARRAAEAAQTRIRDSVEQASMLRDAARKAKVPDAAFAEIDPLFAAADLGLDAIAEALGRDDPLTAEPIAAELKPRAAELPQSVRDARSRWEALHRGRRRPGPASPRS